MADPYIPFGFMPPTLAGPMRPQQSPQPREPYMAARSPTVDELVYERLRALGLPETTARRIGDMVPFTPAGPAFQAGQSFAEGRPGEAAMSAVMALPMARLPMQRPMIGPTMEQLAGSSGPNIPLGRLPSYISDKMPGAPPPGGAWPFAIPGAVAGGVLGDVSDDTSMDSAAGAVAGGMTGYGLGRGLGAGIEALGRRLHAAPPARSNIPDTGPSLEANRYVRSMPSTGRPPAGGGPFASGHEQRAAVSWYMARGNRPPQELWDPAGTHDTYVREALRAYRASQGGQKR